MRDQWDEIKTPRKLHGEKTGGAGGLQRNVNARGDNYKVEWVCGLLAYRARCIRSAYWMAELNWKAMQVGKGMHNELQESIKLDTARSTSSRKILSGSTSNNEGSQ
jgi:hypothetical protein